MRRLHSTYPAAIALTLTITLAVAQQAPPARGAQPARPPVQAKPEELARIKEKTEQIEAIVKELKSKHAKPELLGDVDVYAKAGRMLLEFPEMFGTQAAI